MNDLPVSNPNFNGATAGVVAARIAPLSVKTSHHAVKRQVFVEPASTSEMKLATVFGASFSNNSTTMSPLVVFSNTRGKLLVSISRWRNDCSRAHDCLREYCGLVRTL